MGRWIVVISAFLCALPVLASPDYEDESHEAQQWINDAVMLTKELGGDGYDEKLSGAVKQIADNTDPVLKVVWEYLFKFGSAMFSHLAGWQEIDAFDYSSHVDPQTLEVKDPEAKRALGGLLLDLSSQEARLDLVATEIYARFSEAVDSNRKSDKKYGDLRRFLRLLLSYMASAQGQASHVHQKRLLDAVKGNNPAAATLAAKVEERHEEFYGRLDKIFEELLSAARHCEKSGLLFEGAADFMLALNAL